ncbi:hypothetical protein BUALT_Bualt09G0028400 [Buddleja alternifolia]|uniref:Uncharacterized protein n=1 Tax=Buddleja alternifolia TaxID=168488 RepID=A0AAV6X013_9LAMI|nr:hypothetical protein BUALT_Bualt09G0028400 [Buddleja alternifolia]
MLQRSAVVPHRRGVTAAFFIVFLFFFVVIAESSNNSQAFFISNLDSFMQNSFFNVFFLLSSIGIRYGKYCGVGWTGCPGEKPCDDLDACCKIHDECVEKNGMTNIKCHEKFKRCIKKVHKSGKGGFSKDCPYDTAVPTMAQGMDKAILFSQFGNSLKIEL